jgi:hypothetical protein
MKNEYREGPQARRNIDKGMKKLFSTPGTTIVSVKDIPKPKRKRARATKDSPSRPSLDVAALVSN